FEIGMEEIPARFIRAAVEQLEDRVSRSLREARIDFSGIQSYATPRRIAIIVSSLAEIQTDVTEEIKGPSKKIALDEHGGWSKAAEGYIRSQGIQPSDLYFREVAGVEYIYATRRNEGIATSELLSDLLVQVIHSMTFPKNMRWGSHDLKFVRPIRWIVALYGKDIVPIEVAGVNSSNTTRGHRFLGEDIDLESPQSYVESLKKQYVFADIEERKKMILGQLHSLALEREWTLSIKEDLLEEVLFLVEYPTVLYGGFDSDYLNIPRDVLITSMREHQRYFPVFDRKDRLLPFFVTVRNGDTQSIDQVAKGNEKVLRARLSDARFFYLEDHKMTIDLALNKLESIVYHEGLGSIGDKVRRIRSMAEKLSDKLKLEHAVVKDIKRAAAICKFDLVTQMVYEFPELQGVMGEDYARKFGEDESVAVALNEHYQPRFSGDQSPRSLVGAVISIADKMDTIVGCFSMGIIPTGSQDPYALRRQAAGVIQILLDHQMPCKLSELFDSAIEIYEMNGLMKRNRDQVAQGLQDFFSLRVKNLLSDKARYDVVDAIMASGFDDITSAVGKTSALMGILQLPETKLTLESFNRVNNLAAKALSGHLNANLYMEETEQHLHQAWETTHQQFKDFMNKGEAHKALESLVRLREPITQYFETVMVMSNNESLREARLALLKHISEDLKHFADFQKIVWQG
ncbi:MAG TPA: glycine--tRNA ligase subunit beta, partial [Bacilli bacterium]